MPVPGSDGHAGDERHYDGLLVDWGGVLTSNLFDSFGSFCELEGLERDAVARRFREDRASRELVIELETGRLAEEEFEARFAPILGVAPPGLIDRLFARSRPDALMLGAVRRARDAGVRTGLISNSWSARHYDRALLAELFDGVVISGEVGIRKPAPEIYALAVQRIGVSAAACVFVDDLPVNLEPAAQLGMATVHHVRSLDTVPALERILGVELRPS